MPKVKKVPILCFVCDTPLKLSRAVVLTKNNENPIHKKPNGKIRKIIARHESCEPGSPSWMMSPNIPEHRKRYYYCLYPELRPGYIANTEEKKRTTKKMVNPDHQKALDQYSKITDPVERRKFRRKLRSLGIFVSKEGK